MTVSHISAESYVYVWYEIQEASVGESCERANSWAIVVVFPIFVVFFGTSEVEGVEVHPTLDEIDHLEDYLIIINK